MEQPAESFITIANKIKIWSEEAPQRIKVFLPHLGTAKVFSKNEKRTKNLCTWALSSARRTASSFWPVKWKVKYQSKLVSDPELDKNMTLCKNKDVMSTWMRVKYSSERCCTWDLRYLEQGGWVGKSSQDSQHSPRPRLDVWRPPEYPPSS